MGSGLYLSCTSSQRGRTLLRDFAESRVASGAAVVLTAILVAAVLAPYVAPRDPYDLAQIDILDSSLPPGSRSATGLVYLLGTDDQGRDMLSAILYGLRTSLAVGVVSGVLALGVGVCAGLVAAYAGGYLDTMLMRVVDLQLSLPSILVALALIAVLGQGIDKVILALVAVQWAYYARTARAVGLAECRKEYMAAAVCLAYHHRRIVFRHLLPNVLPAIIVVGTVQVAHAITLEATLSFLGIGLPVTRPSLGLLIANGFEYLLSGRYWMSFFPGIALFLTVAALNLVGDHVRDILNPRLRK